jgi:hypothetical protein
LRFLTAGLTGPGDDHGTHAGLKRPVDYRLAIPVKGTMRQINSNIYDVMLFCHVE